MMAIDLPIRRIFTPLSLTCNSSTAILPPHMANRKNKAVRSGLKIHASYRLSANCLKQLKSEARRLGISQSAVLEIAVRRFAANEEWMARER